MEYTRLANAGYMLDYTIWQYLRTEKQLAIIKEAKPTGNLHTEPEYRALIKVHRNNLNRLTFWQTLLWRLVASCFTSSGYVDTEKLYQVDQEGFNREVLKQIKENDDLTMLMKGTSSPNISAGDKSKRKSPKKKRARKAGKSPVLERLVKVQPQTFERLEQ